jgi:plasmid stabilization system protein ParE
MASYFLTRRAALSMREIYAFSKKKWGIATADAYLEDLYSVFQDTATSPESGNLRFPRSTPFFMVPAREHFVIYDILPQGIVVLAVENQVRDIEALVAGCTPRFFAEIEKIRAKFF